VPINLMEAPMRTRRAPNARALLLANQAFNFAAALRLMGVAMMTLDNPHGRAVFAASWEVCKRLDRLKKQLQGPRAK
jgi:hypothetical protein